MTEALASPGGIRSAFNERVDQGHALSLPRVVMSAADASHRRRPSLFRADAHHEMRGVELSTIGLEIRTVTAVTA